MKYSGIAGTCLVAVLAGALSWAQQQPEVLHSKLYPADELKPRAGGDFKMTPVFDGITTRGEKLEMHMSELAPGQTPNAIHAHVNEEILVIREGTLEVTINETTKTLGPGSVAYTQSNDRVGIKLVGQTTAKYMIFSIGDKQ